MVKIPGVPGIPGLSDLVGVLQAQTEALRALPDTLKALNSSVRALAKLAQDAQSTARRADALFKRVDSILDDLEAPLRALGPLATNLQREVEPIIKNLADTQRQVASIAASTDRITGLINDVGTRIGDFPVPGIVRRRRTAQTSGSTAAEASPEKS
jgi:uncharacterized protein YoxC